MSRGIVCVSKPRRLPGITIFTDGIEITFTKRLASHLTSVRSGLDKGGCELKQISR